jgi:hypothetical protein
MGDVDVTNIPPIDIEQVSNIAPIQIAQISNIAPTAVHVKELNHVAPISIDSLRVDEVRNLDPIKVDQFDVTYLPTVNLTLGEAPELDLNLRQIPPLAVGLHQDFVMPSEYLIRARLLGFEFLRVQVTGRTVMHPRDRVPREVSSSHERSYREVAAVGNPAIPVTCHEEYAETVVHQPRKRRSGARRAAGHRRARAGRSGAGITVGAPPHAFGLARSEPAVLESAVSSI